MLRNLVGPGGGPRGCKTANLTVFGEGPENLRNQWSSPAPHLKRSVIGEVFFCRASGETCESQNLLEQLDKFSS